MKLAAIILAHATAVRVNIEETQDSQELLSIKVFENSDGSISLLNDDKVQQSAWTPGQCENVYPAENKTRPYIGANWVTTHSRNVCMDSCHKAGGTPILNKDDISNSGFRIIKHTSIYVKAW